MRTFEEEKKHRRRQNLISIAIILVGSVAAFIILGPKNEKPAVVEDVQPALVRTMVLAKGETQVAKLEKTVTLEAGDATAEAVSEYSGRITKVNFEVGDSVNKGEVLAEFDQSGLKNAPRVNLTAAQRTFATAQENFSDTEDLTKKSIDLAERAVKIAKLQEDETDKSPTSTSEQKKIADQNIKIAQDQEEQARRSAEVQINTAQLQLEQSRAALNQARVEYEKTIIKAPIGGRISSKSLNEQDYLNPGNVVASIVGQGCLGATIYLSQEEIGRIRQGDRVEIRSDGRVFAGIIEAFSPIANDDNSRYEARISTLEPVSSAVNRPATISLGLYLENQAAGGFFVPVDAVKIGQTKKEVFLVKGGRVVSREITLGTIIGSQAEVTSGLEEGDVIVIENSRNLQDGQPVRIES